MVCGGELVGYWPFACVWNTVGSNEWWPDTMLRAEEERKERLPVIVVVVVVGMIQPGASHLFRFVQLMFKQCSMFLVYMQKLGRLFFHGWERVEGAHHRLPELISFILEALAIGSNTTTYSVQWLHQCYHLYVCTVMCTSDRCMSCRRRQFTHGAFLDVTRRF